MTVTYELYTLVNSRWQIHVRYEEGRREEAISEAQTLEKEAHIERTRVVRDQYDALTNVSREITVYETVLGGDADKKRGGESRGGSSGAGPDLKRKSKGGPKAQGRSQVQLEPTKSEATTGKRAQEMGAQRSKDPSAMAVVTSAAAESVGASAAATSLAPASLIWSPASFKSMWFNCRSFASPVARSLASASLIEANSKQHEPVACRCSSSLSRTSGTPPFNINARPLC